MLASMLAQTPRTAPLIPRSSANDIVSQLPHEYFPKNLESKLVHTPYTEAPTSGTSSTSNAQYGFTNDQMTGCTTTIDGIADACSDRINMVNTSGPFPPFLLDQICSMEEDMKVKPVPPDDMQLIKFLEEISDHVPSTSTQPVSHDVNEKIAIKAIQRQLMSFEVPCSSTVPKNNTCFQKPTAMPQHPVVANRKFLQVSSMEKNLKVEPVSPDDTQLIKLLEEIPDPVPSTSAQPVSHNVNEKMAIKTIQRQLMSIEVPGFPTIPGFPPRNNTLFQQPATKPVAIHQNPAIPRSYAQVNQVGSPAYKLFNPRGEIPSYNHIQINVDKMVPLTIKIDNSQALKQCGGLSVRNQNDLTRQKAPYGGQTQVSNQQLQSRWTVQPNSLYLKPPDLTFYPPSTGVALDQQQNQTLPQQPAQTHLQRPQSTVSVPRVALDQQQNQTLPQQPAQAHLQMLQRTVFIPRVIGSEKNSRKRRNSCEIIEVRPKKVETECHQSSEREVEHKNSYKQLLALNDACLVQNTETFECPVCFSNVNVGEGVILHDCLHSFCKECLASAVEFSESAEVQCPFRNDEYSCECYLQDREIKYLVTAEVYERHLQRSISVAERQAENSFHCKTPDCAGWCMVDDNVNTFKCPVCKLINCLSCGAIHEGMNCQQYQDDVAFQGETSTDAKKTKQLFQHMLNSRKAMKCPKCKIVLMKREGCDWLVCSMCSTEICWATRGPRWGPMGRGDTSGGCKCMVNGQRCHPQCKYCH